MATRIKDLGAAYSGALKETDKKYFRLSIELQRKIAVDSIPEHLKNDEYTQLLYFDSPYTYFLLKGMNFATLVTRLEEMGYKITQSDDDKKGKYIKVEKKTCKEKLPFSFDFSSINPILVVRDRERESEIKSFLKELYREHPDE